MNCNASVRILAMVVALQSLSFCQSLGSGQKCTFLVLERGLFVESVVKGSQGDKLGIKPGDLVLAWTREDANGVIDSPFALAHISVEQASRGPVVISSRTGGHDRIWVFGSDAWGIQTRPNFSGDDLKIYQEAIWLAAAAEPLEAAELLRSAAARLGDCPGWLASWFLSRVGRLLFHARKWKESDEAFGQAIELSQNAGPIARMELFREWASSYEFRGELSQAAKYYQENLLESEKLGPESMEVANALMLLGSLDLQRNDTEEAESHLTRGLSIAGRLAPSSFQTASILEDLGILFEYRDNLGKAEEYYVKALPIEEQHFPNSRQLANTLTNLGTLSHHKGDLSRAEKYHRRALTIAERVEENGPQIADILGNLGECVLDEGDTARAEQYQRHALSIRQEATPGAFAIALNFASLGRIARLRHDLTQAESYYTQAIAAAAKVEAPEPELARLLMGQADVLRERKDYIAAEAIYRRALLIIEKSSPGSVDEAEIRAELAETLRRGGQLNAAAELYSRALDVLETRAPELGGIHENRSRYRAQYVRYYNGYIEALLELGRQDEAFATLEGSRARTMLEMLAQAHITVTRGAEPSILQRERVLRRMLQAKTEDRIRLSASEHTEELPRLDREIDDLLIQQAEVEAQLRSTNPAYAALTQPRRLSTGEIQKLLDQNTLLLEYSLAVDHSHVFAIKKDAISVYDLPPKTVIEDAARKLYDVLTFRKLPANANSQERANFEAEYDRAIRKLSKIVLGPVARWLGTTRLVIVADSALQYIPFSVLSIPGRLGALKPLVLEHEIVNLPSASVLAEIRGQRTSYPQRAGAVAVLADPVFDSSDSRVQARNANGTAIQSHPKRHNDLTQAAKDLGLTRNGTVYLDRLLYTRKEADAVVALVPAGKRFEALDFNANRTTVMSGILAKYRIVHFATHGLLNNKHPELSGLVLSLVNKDGKRQDGFLKLQDIYDLKLPADLVVLSGCETGLGEQINGEGLIGLTRGFMYAGAKRVLASLWSVSDSATATLMAEFYKHMERDHLRPAAALRAAQVYMWRQPQWRSAYYWAAFQMHGEWR